MLTMIKGGTLIDGTGSPPAAGMAVVIEENRIKAVGREADFASQTKGNGVNVIDAAGKWVLPGLINVHEHLMMQEVEGSPLDRMCRSVVEQSALSVRNALVALRRGWTSVRDMAATHGVSLVIRDFIAQGEIPGPRVYACGSPVCVTGGHAHHVCVEADGADACRRAARGQLKAGADFVKVMASHDPYPMPGPEQTRAEISLDEIRAVFEEGRRWGKRTACHAMGTEAIANVLEAGVDVVDHGVYLNDELAERMARQGTILCPTLSAYDRQTMNPRFKRGEEWAKKHSVLVKPHEDSFRAAVRAGVKIVNGTDTTGDYAEELELMREGGLKPMDSILACTGTAAEALGWEDRVGTIAAGKLADIVILDGDPLANPRALELVDLVIKDGVSCRPEEITLNIPF